MAIGGGEVHVWLIALDSVSLEHSSGLLDELEMKRADRFRYDADASRYLAAHLELRRILSAYTGVAPGAIKYVSGPNGKPMLDIMGGRLRFNLSHSGNVASVAVAGGLEVGIDVEQIRDDIHGEDLSAYVFSADEREMLRVSGDPRSFFKLWTRKEAYLKAIGEGLSAPVENVPSYGLEQIECRGQNARGSWSIIDIEPAPGYAGALAASGIVDSIEIFRCPAKDQPG